MLPGHQLFESISPPNPTPTCPSPSGWRCSSPRVCRHRRRQRRRRRRRRLVGAGPGRTGAGHGPPPAGPGPPVVLNEYNGLQTELVPERLIQAARFQSWFQRWFIADSLQIHCRCIAGLLLVHCWFIVDSLYIIADSLQIHCAHLLLFHLFCIVISSTHCCFIVFLL